MSKFHYLRLMLIPFSFLYWMLISLKFLIYNSNLLRKFLKIEAYHSSIPIICVGNIRVGGTGKTQIVIELSKKLDELGYKIAILSRGYKRKSHGFFEVISDDFEKFGDEPVLIKSNLKNVRVFVSEDRKKGIQKIQEKEDFDFIVMDDGLQNLKVRKDLSIVLIDKNYFSKNLLENLLLPAGNLRETKKNISYYDFIIFNQKFDEFKLDVAFDNFYIAHYNFITFADLNGISHRIEDIRTKTIIAICGIAQPDSFIKLLEKNRIFAKFSRFFPDHHIYDIQDLKLLLKFVEKFGSNYIVTTEKDFIRLKKFKDEFERAGVFLLYAKITASIRSENEIVNRILCLKGK